MIEDFEFAKRCDVKYTLDCGNKGGRHLPGLERRALHIA